MRHIATLSRFSRFLSSSYLPWDSTRWQIDEDETVLWAAGDLAESSATTDPRGVHSTTALQHHRRRALSTSGMNAMLTQAKSAPGMVFNASQLDADPYALCTPADVVKLVGDYADATPPGFLMARPYDGHPTDLRLCRNGGPHRAVPERMLPAGSVLVRERNRRSSTRRTRRGVRMREPRPSRPGRSRHAFARWWGWRRPRR
ncbi:hypothetical protein [Streptomyces sp. NPDC051636]|uniref:hypothetical protein n=1 Tax=Streptomyces sp. NPDC051636 TaxID=3365663 RepID=UPI0037938017